MGTTKLSDLQVPAHVVRASSRWLRLLVGWGSWGQLGRSWQNWRALELELEATLARS